MKIAFVSDVHGNLPALEACLRLVERVGCGRLYGMGDMFGYFPDGPACLDLLLDRADRLLAGNHEAMLTGTLDIAAGDEVHRLSHVRSILTRKQLDQLAGLLPYHEVFLPSGRHVLLTHGTPWDPWEGRLYPDSPLDSFAGLVHDVVLTANTHRPFIGRRADPVVVNVGSCGLPRDVGDSGSFAVLDDRSGEVDVVRFPLPVGAIRQRYSDAHPSVLAMLERRPRGEA